MSISELRLTAVNFELKLAWKYSRARRKSLARFTAIVAVVGIASGVAALIVAQALSRGFADEMRDKILSNTAHITIFRRDLAEISDWENLKANLEKIENIKAVEATTYESALITGQKSTSYCILRAMSEPSAVAGGLTRKENSPQMNTDSHGFEIENKTQSKSEISNFKFQIEDQSPKSEVRPIKISIGAELAEKTGLQIDDEAEIIFPDSGDYAPKSARVLVKRIFRTGLYDYDSTWIYVSFEDFAKLAGKPKFAPTVLSVSVRDIYAADQTSGEIRRILGDEYKVLDWQEANRPLFAALSLERKLTLAIISLIIFIAVLNITTTLALLVNERRLDIAVLRTCGARTRSLITIFLLEGLFLGAVGIVSGSGLGLLLCFAGNRFRIISLPPDVYSLSYIPLAPLASDVFVIAAIAFALSLAATVYPAFRAARLKPLENLRNQ
ncbi:MAG TPA: ABC transporter permease [Pyrinomonadaceae bacterium]